MRRADGGKRGGRGSPCAEELILHFTGPQVPITARTHSTPRVRRNRPACNVSKAESGRAVGESGELDTG
eukprot:9478179-Pyramimonas_sp.AAC.1